MTYEKLEQENKHLREIVRKLLEELTKVLRELFEVSKPQALSEPDTQSGGEEVGVWVAQDRDGEWWVYTDEPSIEDDCVWDVVDSHTSDSMRLRSTPESADWKNTKTYLSKKL